MPKTAPDTIKLNIYRYDPDSGEQHRMQTLIVEKHPEDRMLLDLIVRIKSDIDDSISFRRSCREGVCGVKHKLAVMPSFALFHELTHTGMRNFL